MDFVHEGYSKIPPCMRYVFYRSSLSQSRNRDTRNTCQLARLSKFYQAAKALEKYSIARSIDPFSTVRILKSESPPLQMTFTTAHNPSILIIILN